MALGSKAVRGLALWRELRQLPDWRGSCRGRALVLRARARPEGQRRLLRRFAVVALALAARYELDPDLSLQGSRLSVTLTDPAGPGITLRALELARELSRLAASFAVPVVVPRRLGLSGRERARTPSASKPNLLARARGPEREPTRASWVDPAGAVLPQLTVLGRALFRHSWRPRPGQRGLLVLGLWLALVGLAGCPQTRPTAGPGRAPEAVATDAQSEALARGQEHLRAARERMSSKRFSVVLWGEAAAEYSQALEEFEKACQVAPSSGLAELGRGEALLGLGRPSEAGEACRRAEERDSTVSAEAALCQLRAHLAQGEVSLALALCARARRVSAEKLEWARRGLESFRSSEPGLPAEVEAELGACLAEPGAPR